MTEDQAFSKVYSTVKQTKNYIPRNYQTVGGFWTVDTYAIEVNGSKVTAQSMDEGYTDKIISEKVVAFRFCNGKIDYMKGNLADLIELAGAIQ